ncbi:fumarylacetoacetate hydrolase family protein [Burkholderia sp. Bp9140]|uniref:fumarylacetoacetate hydrolase family protein n=1 Tax=Burkholderia sp. Bp9140 TaxID=2184572 RepID=UPI000F57F949|nr:fumarylacetoacetate hydrolase family protein [Burkholderia sp. Bp9140]RQR51308.1 fumarylacetoacetate hydrolase family protein [Burkholderia sp. Bp9140]
MKLLTIRSGDASHAGVLVGENVIDLVVVRRHVPFATCLAQTVAGLLEHGEEGLRIIRRVIEFAEDPTSRQTLKDASAYVPLKDVTLAPVIPDPQIVLCGSMNSRGHTREMGDELPEYPCAFHKVRSALTASGAPIVPPPSHGNMIDWEGELCVVIGKRCHNVSIDEAQDCIAGYTLMNDISAREFVGPFVTAVGAAPTAQAWERNVLGKNFPTFAPIGPVIVTRDEVSNPLTYHIETLVNGEVMQSSTHEDLVFGPAEMISYFSKFYIFEPGDIISMGSPPGVGMARKPPRFLKPGDEVVVRVKEIGELINRVVVPANIR